MSLIAIAIFALALRLAYAAKSGLLRHPQTWEQEEIATNLLESHQFLYSKDGVVYRSYTEPLYPFIAAGLYLLTDHNRSVLVIVQLIVAAATVWMVGLLALLATQRHAAAFAAASLMAIHPGFIRYSAILHPIVLDTFFFVAAAAALVHYRHEPSLRRGILAAATIGIGALTRPTILVLLAPLLWMAWRSRDTTARRFGRAALLALTTFALIAPWTIRNAFVQHTFMLTRSGTGFVFWLGNNPASSGSAVDINGLPILSRAPPELRARAFAAEVIRDRIFSDEAWRYIRADPTAAIVRAAERLYDFWWFSPQWGAAFTRPEKIVYRAWWLLLLVLIAWGLMGTRNCDLWLLVTLALLISVGQSIYYVEGRHRLAIEPLLLPIAGYALVRRPRIDLASPTGFEPVLPP